MGDPAIKYIRTIDHKEIRLTPEGILIDSDDGEASICLGKDGGIAIKGQRGIYIQAKGDVDITAGSDITLTAGGSVEISGGSGSIRLGENGDTVIKGARILEEGNGISVVEDKFQSIGTGYQSPPTLSTLGIGGNIGSPLVGSNRSSYSVKGVGDKDEVLKVQKYLRTLHYLSGGKDGVFDDATHRALIKFRRQFNLALLMDQDGKQYKQTTFSDYQKEQSLSLHLLEIYAKIIENKDGPKTKKVDWIYYDPKKKGQSVTIGGEKYTTIKIMERLEHAGYTIPMTEKKDEIFGDSMLRATLHFQLKHSGAIMISGNIGESTIKKLNELNAIKKDDEKLKWGKPLVGKSMVDHKSNMDPGEAVTRTLYGESDPKASMEGQLAIAVVLRNRMRKDKQNEKEVIFADTQFECTWLTGNGSACPDRTSDLWERCVDIGINFRKITEDDKSLTEYMSKKKMSSSVQGNVLKVYKNKIVRFFGTDFFKFKKDRNGINPENDIEIGGNTFFNDK